MGVERGGSGPGCRGGVARPLLDGGQEVSPPFLGPPRIPRIQPRNLPLPVYWSASGCVLKVNNVAPETKLPPGQ